MICQNCTNVLLYSCSNTITLGVPPDPLADYLLKIEDITNGRILVLPVSNDGLLMTVNVEDFQFASNHSYEFSLTLEGELAVPISWTLEDNTTEVDCLQVKFQKPIDAGDEIFYISNQIVRK